MVVSAKTLSDAQLSAVSDVLKKAVGTNVSVEAEVDEGIARTALILVGPALQSESFDESCLYAPDYDRRYRPMTADSPWASWSHGDD